MITSVDRRVTKKGDPWAIVTLEDLDASIEVLFFPAAYSLHAGSLIDDTALSVSGRLNERDGARNIYAQELTVLDTSSLGASAGAPVVLTVRALQITPTLIDELKTILHAHQGSTPVQLHMQQRQGGVIRFALPGWAVTPDGSFMADIKELLGPSVLHHE